MASKSRTQVGLSRGLSRRTIDAQPQDMTGAIICKVLHVDPTRNTADLATEWGGIMRAVIILNNVGGTREGATGMPDVVAWKRHDEPDGPVDEYEHGYIRDSQAVVIFIDKKMQQPVCWLLPPNATESSFPEYSQHVDRHPSGVYEQTYVDMQLPEDLRYKPNDRAKLLPAGASWEKVFPDRVNATERVNSDEHDIERESFFKFGYPWKKGAREELSASGDAGKVSGWTDKDWEGEPDGLTLDGQNPPPPPDNRGIHRRRLGEKEQGSVNYDRADMPWQRVFEWKARFARGWRLNQRWGSYLQTDRYGDMSLWAEGINKLVHPNMEQDWVAPLKQEKPDHNRGELRFWIRTMFQTTGKSGWAYYRKRRKRGGRQESWPITETSEGEEQDEDQVRRWGMLRQRIQRTYQVLSRHEAVMGARSNVKIRAGRVDLDTGDDWGPDDPYYTDRIRWRNRDSDERGDLTIESIRPPLDDFGGDPKLRSRDEGGEIHIRSKPVEGDNAPIVIESLAAEEHALVQVSARPGQVIATKGDARVLVEALAPKADVAHITSHAQARNEAAILQHAQATVASAQITQLAEAPAGAVITVTAIAAGGALVEIASVGADALVTIDAPTGQVMVSAVKIILNGEVVINGNVTIAGILTIRDPLDGIINVNTHTHGGITAGGARTLAMDV